MCGHLACGAEGSVQRCALRPFFCRPVTLAISLSRSLGFVMAIATALCFQAALGSGCHCALPSGAVWAVCCFRLAAQSAPPLRKGHPSPCDCSSSLITTPLRTDRASQRRTWPVCGGGGGKNVRAYACACNAHPFSPVQHAVASKSSPGFQSLSHSPLPLHKNKTRCYENENENENEGPEKAGPQCS